MSDVAKSWDARVRPFKEAFNSTYERVRPTVTLGALAISATGFKRELAGKGTIAVQSIGHWLAHPGRGKPGATSARWTEANARIPSTRDDVWALVLALAHEGALWIESDGSAPKLDYETAVRMTSSLGFHPVPIRLLEEASEHRSVQDLVAQWTRALDSTSPRMMDAILRHMLGDILNAPADSAAPGIMCVAGLSQPARSASGPLVEAVFDFVKRGGVFAVVIPFDVDASPETSRFSRSEVIREWMDLVRGLRRRFDDKGIGEPDARIRLVVPRSCQKATEETTNDGESPLSLAMRLVPPFLGQEGRPLLVAAFTGQPPDRYRYRVGVMLRGADGARRLVQRYPIEDHPGMGVPIDIAGSSGEDRRFRAEVECAATRDFFAPILAHWKSNGHKTLGGKLPAGIWEFAL